MSNTIDIDIDKDEEEGCPSDAAENNSGQHKFVFIRGTYEMSLYRCIYCGLEVLN